MFININNIYILCIVANMYKYTINIKDIEEKKRKFQLLVLKLFTNPTRHIIIYELV